MYGWEGQDKAEFQKEKVIQTGRAVTGTGEIWAQLPLWCPKPHLSKISTRVQAKRRRPSGICKATVRHSRNETKGMARGWDEDTAPGWTRQPLLPYPNPKAWRLTLLGLGFLDPPDGLGDLKVIVGRQDLNGCLQVGIVQDLRGDLIGKAAPRGST